jgi:preprotein translocase subunit SecG
MNLFIISQVAQIIVAVTLILLTLIQSKGAGLSSAVSGGIGFYRSRRGIEKAVFILTIVCGVLLVTNSLLLLFIR